MFANLHVKRFLYRQIINIMFKIKERILSNKFKGWLNKQIKCLPHKEYPT